MSNHDKTNRKSAETIQPKTADRTPENTVNSNTPGGSPGEDLMLPSLLDADPDLADDAQAMVDDDDESPQVGRPRIDRADLAERCHNGLFIKHGAGNRSRTCDLRHNDSPIERRHQAFSGQA